MVKIPPTFTLARSHLRKRAAVAALYPLAAALVAGPVAILALIVTPAGAGDAPAPSAAPVIATQTAPAAPSPSAVVRVPVLYLREAIPGHVEPLSLLDLPAPDDGIAGARLAVMDNNTTGRFLGQEFTLSNLESANADDLTAEAVKQVANGFGFVVVDASPETLLKIADALKDKDALVLNASAPDDRLREEDCRANVRHLPPTRTMLADALTQYLVWKRWSKWFLIQGPRPEDQLMADAYRHAAKKFGARIVEERTFKDEGGSRRADGGYEQVQQQMPTFTQNAAAHDIVIVADESNQFGDYLPYRTWDPRPVAGTAGLVPMSWHPALELWGGTQFQNRFKKLTGRIMRPIDYTAWMAVRVVGEAASRTRSNDPKTLIAYINSKAFELAAFKGIATSFRDWNGQLRQPILVATPKLPVSVSPQPGYLHQVSELDTLGIDKPETKCKAFAP